MAKDREKLFAIIGWETIQPKRKFKKVRSGAGADVGAADGINATKD